MLKRRLWRLAQRKPYSDCISYTLAPFAISSLLAFQNKPTIASIGFFIFASSACWFAWSGRILEEQRIENLKKIKRLEQELLEVNGTGNEDSIDSFFTLDGAQARATITEINCKFQYTNRRRIAIMGEGSESEEVRVFSMGSRSS